MKDHYSTTEAAQILAVNRVTIFRWIKQGKIKAEKVGKNYIIPASEVRVERETESEKEEQIREAVKRVVSEYGSTLKKLGEE